MPVRPHPSVEERVETLLRIDELSPLVSAKFFETVGFNSHVGFSL